MIDSYEKESQKSKDKPKIQKINYEIDEDFPLNMKNVDENRFKPKSNLADLISKTAVDIYKLFSKKNN